MFYGTETHYCLYQWLFFIIHKRVNRRCLWREIMTVGYRTFCGFSVMEDELLALDFRVLEDECKYHPLHLIVCEGGDSNPLVHMNVIAFSFIIAGKSFQIWLLPVICFSARIVLSTSIAHSKLHVPPELGVTS